MCRPKLSHNAEVLRAANCNVSRKVSGENKVSDNKTAGQDGSGKGDDTAKKLLLGIAAALGVGGLVITSYIMCSFNVKV